MTNRTISLAVAGFLSVLLLSGCTFPAYLTVSAARVATAAEKAVESKTASPSAIDCGTDSVKLVDGTTVDCILTDPKTGDRFASPVTIVEVSGADFAVRVDIAEIPTNRAHTPTPTETPVPIAEGSPLVSADILAALVVKALSPQLDYVPEVSCVLDAALVVGNTTDCSLTDDQGEVRDVLVEITAFDGANYSIAAKFVN